ncbi:nucleobindin 1 [Rhynchophorus ferrugineus]|uniref:nucleobindin 1 n=1 Tax=Rhynchophorus ferrugineus TaxID=354439 RepID=UPI003FCC75F3
MKYTILAIYVISIVIEICFAPPVSQNKNEEQEADSNMGDLEDYMEYHRYLKEVVKALESDPDFRQKLEKADESEIRSGKIADELQFVSHHVRTRLDEIKRIELQRLRMLTEKKQKLEQENNLVEDPVHHHLDQSNLHSFEIEDLKKLIAKTTQDLAEVDKKRKEDFKRYEMEKEYARQEKLNHTNGQEREKLEKEYKEMEDKHKKHEKLHEPGHKAQLEEVWEEQDQMQQDFDPKTFFMLHDVDGNGLWDQEEVKALFIKELDKIYQQGVPEDDMRERVEEMERMRESVFREMDTNRDQFIDYREFLQQTNSNDFKQDHGWQTLDDQTKPYSDEELAEYIRQHHAANQIPQYGYQQYPQPPSGANQGVYQQVPQGYQVPPQQQFHPGQVPQMAPQQLDLNTNEVYQHQQPPQQYQKMPQQAMNNQGQQVYQQNNPQQGHAPIQNHPPQRPPQYPNQQAQQNQQFQQQNANQQFQQPNPNSQQQPPQVPVQQANPQTQQQPSNIPVQQPNPQFQQPPNVPVQQPNPQFQQQPPNVPVQQQYQQPIQQNPPPVHQQQQNPHPNVVQSH